MDTLSETVTIMLLGIVVQCVTLQQIIRSVLSPSWVATANHVLPSDPILCILSSYLKSTLSTSINLLFALPPALASFYPYIHCPFSGHVQFVSVWPLRLLSPKHLLWSKGLTSNPFYNMRCMCTKQSQSRTMNRVVTSFLHCELHVYLSSGWPYHNLICGFSDYNSDQITRHLSPQV